MATIKSLKPRLFCTALDVIRLAPDISNSLDISNTSFVDATQPITVDEIESKILAAKGTIHMHLNVVYASTSLRTTPWCGIALRSYSNSSTGKLWAATAGENAHTEMWKITFTSSTEFSVQGTKSGTVGSGSTGATFTATGSDLVILSNMWTGTHATTDVHYIPTYDTYPDLVEISAKLAAAYVLQGIYTQGVPNEQDLSVKYERQAINYLKRAVRPDAPDGLAIGGRPASLDLENLASPYNIDEFGDDKTKYYPDYLTIEDDED